MVALLHRLLLDDGGTSLPEYALLAATLGASMIAGVALLETNAAGELNGTAAGVQNMALTPP